MSSSNHSRDDGDEESSSSDVEDMETNDQSGVTHMKHLAQFALAGIMKHGARNSEQMEKLIVRSWEVLKIPESRDCITAELMEDLVKRINDQITKFDLEVKITFGEFTGEQLFILTMTKESPMMTFQSKYKKQEIEMIQNIMASMLAKSSSWCLSMSECIEVAQKVQARMSYRDGEKFIREMIHTFYFTEVPSNTREDGQIVTLGARSIQEFSSIIQEKFPGVIANCKLCVQYLIHGYKCPVCDVTIHIHCAQGYLARTNKCPAGSKCNAAWDRVDQLHHRTTFAVSEDPSPQGNEDGPPKKRQKPVRRTTQAIHSSSSDADTESD